MQPSSRQPGKHRLGTPGLVHCVDYRDVADALAEYRRNWFTALLTPAKHSLAGLRRRARAAAREHARRHAWAPAT